MKKQQDPLLNREDALKAENTFLKLKLGLEHGMQMSENAALPPDVENQWLKSVYASEEQYKDAKRTTVYQYLGKPEFRKWDTLSPEALVTELDRMELLMARHHLALDCLCEYDKALIYKFITEELFQHEVDDMRIPGMTYHFIYEEFHPNHDYDLRHDSEQLINAVFTRSWDPSFDIYKLGKEVMFSGKVYDRGGISSIIRAFQEAHRFFKLKTFEIRNVAINPDASAGSVQAHLQWSAQTERGTAVWHEGACSFHFTREDEAWSIGAFKIPGFSE